MLIVKCVVFLIALCGGFIFGVHLIVHNRVVTINLLNNTDIFKTKIMARQVGKDFSRWRYLFSRFMMYLSGLICLVTTAVGIVKYVSIILVAI